MRNKKVKFITQTAIFLALLIALQFFSKPLGQLVTGSLVNFVMIAAVLLSGLASGILVALLSPFFAFLLGIGPNFIQVVPIVAVGNLVLVLVYGLTFQYWKPKKAVSWCFSILVGSGLKFLTLFYGVVKLALPFIPGINEKQSAVLFSMFSWPQLLTAILGGILALIVVPLIQKARTGKTIS